MTPNTPAHTPPDTPDIRPADEQDAEALRALRLDGLRRHPEAFGADYAQAAAQTAQYWVEMIRSYREQQTGAVFAASAGGDLVGMCGISRRPRPKSWHSGTVWGVYVRPEWRGRHVARGLVLACLDWGRASGLRIVKLAVVTANAAAVRCYSACGFRVYGVEPKAIHHDGTDHDELLMAVEV